jgi:hypothetical protein
MFRAVKRSAGEDVESCCVRTDKKGASRQFLTQACRGDDIILPVESSDAGRAHVLLHFDGLNVWEPGPASLIDPVSVSSCDGLIYRCA